MLLEPGLRSSWNTSAWFDENFRWREHWGSHGEAHHPSIGTRQVDIFGSYSPKLNFFTCCMTDFLNQKSSLPPLKVPNDAPLPAGGPAPLPPHLRLHALHDGQDASRHGLPQVLHCCKITGLSVGTCMGSPNDLLRSVFIWHLGALTRFSVCFVVILKPSLL